MKRWIFLSLALTLALGLAGCGGSDNTPHSSTVTVTAANSGQTFSLLAGDTLFVRLDEPSGTLYSYQVTSNNASLLQPVGTPTFETPTSQGGITGGPVTKVFRFLALGSGSETLEFRSQAPGGQDAPSANTIQYTVTVASP